MRRPVATHLHVDDMRLDPIKHAELVTGRPQSALIDLWSRSGFAAAVSEVDGPHVYAYGDLPCSTVAITLYDVRRHVLIENGHVRRDGRVKAGRFRIGVPGRDVLVDAVPDVSSGKLLILYLGDALLGEIGATRGGGPVELMDRAWDVEDPLLMLAASRIVEASAAAASGHSLLADQLAYTLALHVSDRYAVPVKGGAEPDLPFDRRMPGRVVEMVRSDPAADISLAMLAREAGLTPSGFIRAFKRSTGVTPHRFILEERIRIAQALLSGTELPIAEVALATGFSSQSHLGTTFRAIAGISPGRWRQERLRPIF
ncbi:AraC family transcriptional regulator [Bosea sp. TWI1241]|uniref:AraC family transcriptional regulator n=1 Tax=Bosea sp. TWI1241 TaxID=3148904 RepID=UPI0032090C90